MLEPRNNPCGSCPYRKDCPSGVWDESEYLKLIEYDKDTGSQPTGVFMCHTDRDDKTMCRGWLDTHQKEELLSLRLACSMGEVDQEIFVLPKSDTPTFHSGLAAAIHGKADIEAPSPKAVKVIRKLSYQRNKKIWPDQH